MRLCEYLMQPLNRSVLLSDIGMTPALQTAVPVNSTRSGKSRTWGAFLIFGAAAVFFGLGIHDTLFEDESAYISQTFYANLFFSGQLDHKLWLEREAYDLQPLPKYLMGLAFRLSRLPMPGLSNSRKWYDDYHSFGGITSLVAARLTIVPLGALGCMALFAAGAIIKNARVGLFAAVLLMINPLYALHAHRAMSDVPCDAFMVSSLALWLWVWARIWSRGFGFAIVLLPFFAGVLSGLSLSCKLNGFIGVGVIVAWSMATWLAPGLSIGRKLAVSLAAVITVAAALGTCVALNPFLTAHPSGHLKGDARVLLPKKPWERFRCQIDFRQTLSAGQKLNFPNDALYDLSERSKVILLQGFGRFGLFGPRAADSRERFDFRQDWGVVLWLPLVAFGFLELLRLGRAQLRDGQPPAAWALLIWAGCAWAVVTVYLPMAWDRYQLPIQSGNALLVAVGCACLWDRRVRARRVEPAAEGV